MRPRYHDAGIDTRRGRGCLRHPRPAAMSMRSLLADALVGVRDRLSFTGPGLGPRLKTRAWRSHDGHEDQADHMVPTPMRKTPPMPWMPV